MTVPDSTNPELNKSNNIFLVGLMGTGKSTVGRRLAKKLQLHFYDSDHEIERRTGANIALIFEIEGEHGFRKRESEMLDGITKLSHIVLATGGGAVLDPDTRKVLADRGFVVYLRTGLAQLVQRTSRDTKRPLLNTSDPIKKIEELLEIRGPLYEEIADLIVDTDQRTIQSIVDEISVHQAIQ
jgi:Shikimate kinase